MSEHNFSQKSPCLCTACETRFPVKGASVVCLALHFLLSGKNARLVRGGVRGGQLSDAEVAPRKQGHRRRDARLVPPSRRCGFVSAASFRSPSQRGGQLRSCSVPKPCCCVAAADSALPAQGPRRAAVISQRRVRGGVRGGQLSDAEERRRLSPRRARRIVVGRRHRTDSTRTAAASSEHLVRPSRATDCD